MNEPEPVTAEVPWHAYVNLVSDRMRGIMAPPIDPDNSPASSIADQFLLRTIETLGATLTHQLNEISREFSTRLDRMEGRFDAVVSKGEFEAEVRRLEREHRIYESEIDKLWEARRADKRENAEALHSKVVRFRWFVGIGLTAATFLSAVTFGVLGALQ